MTLPKFRAWHKPMQRMSEVLAISYERQKVKIRHLTLSDSVGRSGSQSTYERYVKGYERY